MRTYFALLLFIAVACTQTEDARLLEKQQDLENYYKNQLKQDLPKNEVIVILQTAQCSACRKESFMAITGLLQKTRLHKTFIMPQLDTALAPMLLNFQNDRIQIDTGGKLGQYGLDYASDLCFIIENGKIKQWFEIENFNQKNIQHPE